MAFRLLTSPSTRRYYPKLLNGIATSTMSTTRPTMMVARSGGLRSLSTQMTEMPSAHDLVINLTLVDPNGARRQISGMVGKTLHEVCTMYRIDLGPECRIGDPQSVRSDTWTEPLFGEGPTSGFDHVVLHGNGIETAEEKTWEEQFMLEEYWEDDEIFPESRLACMVKLTKEMDNMIVYVPDRIVDDIP